MGKGVDPNFDFGDILRPKPKTLPQEINELEMEKDQLEYQLEMIRQQIYHKKKLIKGLTKDEMKNG